MHARTAILQHSLLPSEGHKIQYPLHNVLNGNLRNRHLLAAWNLPNCKELITARKNYPTARITLFIDKRHFDDFTTHCL